MNNPDVEYEYEENSWVEYGYRLAPEEQVLTNKMDRLEVWISREERVVCVICPECGEIILHYNTMHWCPETGEQGPFDWWYESFLTAWWPTRVGSLGAGKRVPGKRQAHSDT
jgi:predicted RNA-binding Zn-ribbon protein involved in translation (DUF1610 family)